MFVLATLAGQASTAINAGAGTRGGGGEAVAARNKAKARNTVSPLAFSFALGHQPPPPPTFVHKMKRENMQKRDAPAGVLLALAARGGGWVPPHVGGIGGEGRQKQHHTHTHTHTHTSHTRPRPTSGASHTHVSTRQPADTTALSARSLRRPSCCSGTGCRVRRVRLQRSCHSGATPRHPGHPVPNCAWVLAASLFRCSLAS